MSPGDAYNAIRAFDSVHRVRIGQVAIPQLLGAKPAVYAMAPETENSIVDDLYVNLTLPPNPQQVWQIHRTLNGIPNTLEQITASLLRGRADARSRPSRSLPHGDEHQFGSTPAISPKSRSRCRSGVLAKIACVFVRQSSTKSANNFLSIMRPTNFGVPKCPDRFRACNF
jgi:hypothetical protein